VISPPTAASRCIFASFRIELKTVHLHPHGMIPHRLQPFPPITSTSFNRRRKYGRRSTCRPVARPTQQGLKQRTRADGSAPSPGRGSGKGRGERSLRLVVPLESGTENLRESALPTSRSSDGFDQMTGLSNTARHVTACVAVMAWVGTVMTGPKPLSEYRSRFGAESDLGQARSPPWLHAPAFLDPRGSAWRIDRPRPSHLARVPRPPLARRRPAHSAEGLCEDLGRGIGQRG
jgi:hypothetical protein